MHNIQRCASVPLRKVTDEERSVILKCHLTNWKSANKTEIAQNLDLSVGQISAISAWASPTLGGKRYVLKYLPKEFVEKYWDEFCSR